MNGFISFFALCKPLTAEATEADKRSNSSQFRCPMRTSTEALCSHELSSLLRMVRRLAAVQIQLELTTSEALCYLLRENMLQQVRRVGK
jgi:hypothetical protein